MGGPTTFYDHSFDFHRYAGHELLVTLFAPLIRERRWELIQDLLETQLIIHSINHPDGESATFERVSDSPGIIQMGSNALGLNRVSRHADILHERHAEGGALSEVIPEQEFMEADYFLFLRAVVSPSDRPDYPAWAPWSCLYLRRTPSYLLDAVRSSIAEPLAKVFGLGGVNAFRMRLADRARLVRQIVPNAGLVTILSSASTSNPSARAHNLLGGLRFRLSVAELRRLVHHRSTVASSGCV
jgi:hypothetical protein